MPIDTSNVYQAHCCRGVHVSDAEVGRSTVLDLIANHAARQPDAPFVTEVPESGPPWTITFRQLHDLSLRCAAWLSRKLDVRHGSTLALIPRNDLRSVVAIFASMRLGARIAFLDPGAPPARQRLIVDALQVDAVVRSPDAPDSIDSRVLPELGELDDRWDNAPSPDPADDAFYFGTSGSTATSKIVAQTHRATLSNALAVRRHHLLAPGDRLLSCLPIHHVNGLHFTIMATAAAGAHAILVHGFDPLQYPQLILQHAPRIVSVVPSLLQALVVTWRTAAPPPGLERFVSAAAPLPREVARAVWERWRVRVLQGYGLTETTNFSTTLPADLAEPAYRRQMIDAELPTIGIAIDGNDVAVLDEDGRPVETGQPGEICVRGHNVMDRYVSNVEETERAFRHGWFHTGDIGFVRSDAETDLHFVVVAGRAKNIAKVRGESVSLDEMERTLLMLTGIHDAACTALPSRVLGEAIVAAIVADDRVSDDAIRDHLRTVFAENALPSLIRMVVIPRTPTGKILRPQLREQVMAMQR